MEVDDPLFDQEMVALLSLAIHKVCSRVSRTQPVTTALWATMPANYKSELEMLPVLCFAVIKDEDTVGAEGARHITVARPSGKSQTPPIMPRWHASQAPMVIGAWGASSYKRVGRLTKESTRRRKSTAVTWTCRLRRTRRRSPLLSASCNVEKNPRVLGSACRWSFRCGDHGMLAT